MLDGMVAVEHHDVVRAEWVDDNGHMNLAYYVLVFDRGTDTWLEKAGLGHSYRQTGGTVFAVESHILYRREVRAGDTLHVATALAAVSGNRLHLLHEMRSDGIISACQEVLFLHVDLATRRATPLPPGLAERVAALAPAPGTMMPEWVGRRVGAGTRKPY